MNREFEWHELIDRHLYGELNESEKERLTEWLDSDPAARKAFVEQVQWDTQLSDALREHSDSQCIPMTKQIAGLNSAEPTTTRRKQRPMRRLTRHLLTAPGLAAALLIVFSLGMALIRSQKEVTELKHELTLARRDTAPAGIDESTIINIYAREHRDVVAQHASLKQAQPEPMHMQVDQDDVLYYENIYDRLEAVHPGIIVRGPLSQGPIGTPATPAISNGHTLSLSEAREACDFDMVSPRWLLACYRLDQVRTIEGRDALQLLYTNGINSISLFEQSLKGQRRLSHHDFREYAVYNDTEHEGATILAWRDNTLSYVLIGNTGLSQLMDMAQSIKGRKVAP